MYDLAIAIVGFGLLICVIGYWIYEKLLDIKKDVSKDTIYKNIWYFSALIICGFSTSCYLIAFKISIYILLIPIIAMIISKVFEKNNLLRKISVFVMITSIILIGIYCYYRVSHNNRFLKQSQYIDGIPSMGRETTDVKALINAVIENNKKDFGKQVVVKCRLNNSSSKYNEKSQENNYTTVQELGWLLENIDVTKTSIYFDYDNKNQFIESIEILISATEYTSEQAFWEYIVEFNKDDVDIDYIKDFFVKARQKRDETQNENIQQVVIEEKPIKVVYDVYNREKIEIDSLEEKEVNKILEQLDEERTYRLLIQTYNDYYKISIMD